MSRGGKSVSPVVWVLVVLLDVMVIAALAAVFLTGGSAAFLRIFRFFARHAGWFAAGGVAVFASILVVAHRQSIRPPESLERLAASLAAPLRRCWGIQGAFGRVSLFGYGSYFTFPFRGRPFACSCISGETGDEGFRLHLPHVRPLALGIGCRYGIGSCEGGLLPREHRDLLASSLDPGDNEIDAWAINEWAARILRDAPVLRDAMQSLKRACREVEGGFFLGDVGVTVILREAGGLEKALVERMGDLSDAAASLRGPVPGKVPGWVDRMVRSLIVLLVGLVFLSLLWAVADLFLR